MRGAGEPDYVATAEPRLARAAALAYGLDAPLPAEELARRAEAWRPYRSWVGVLLRLGLEDASHGSRGRFEPARPGRPARPGAATLSARAGTSCRR